MSRSIAFECFGSRVTLQMSPGMCDEVNEVASKLMEFGRSRDWQRSLALPPETVFGSPFCGLPEVLYKHQIWNVIPSIPLFLDKE